MVDDPKYANLVLDPYDEVIQKYQSCIGSLASYKEDNQNTNVKFCYTGIFFFFFFFIFFF